MVPVGMFYECVHCVYTLCGICVYCVATVWSVMGLCVNSVSTVCVWLQMISSGSRLCPALPARPLASARATQRQLCLWLRDRDIP